MQLTKSHWQLINSAGLLLLAYILTDPFNLELLFKDTILTGGDAGSWYQVALHLKESLLPNGRLFGWDQGNFFGYPNLQHYFVFPFLLIVLLSYVIPLTIALKLVSISGFFALPFVVYWSLRKLKYQNPVPLLGAWVVLAFMFHQRHAMFGGNLLSVLAGEFCYSFTFSLMVVFLTYLIIDLKQDKLSIRSGVLLGIIGLSHAFVFFVAALMPLYFFIKKPERITLKNIFIVYFLGFLIMAFWVLPMLSNLYYTTPIIINWRFPQNFEFLKTINYEIMIVAISCATLYVFRKFRTTEGAFFIYMAACSFMLYLIATALHVPDIRFFPPLLFFSLLLIVDGSAILLNHLKVNKNIASFAILGLGIVFGASYIFSKDNVSYEWFYSNYAGYEEQKAFENGHASKLFNSLKGTYNDPRVAWEQGRHDLEFGTMRFFENIPLFTGRASTEGIHYASALLSLPITILHGEYSKVVGSPSPNIYSHYFIEGLPDRFRMLNIRDFIAFSPEITKLIRDSGNFDVVEEQLPYTVFKLKNFNSQYVESPKYQPLLTEDYKDWKFRFNNWFRLDENNDLTLINGHIVPQDQGNDLLNLKKVKLDITGRINNPTKDPLTPAKISHINISNQEISFDTDKPGTPHIIKIAYSPLWQSLKSENLYMIAPGFMLIYPQTTHVVIRYGRHWSEYFGLILSLSGLLFLFYFTYHNYQLLKLFSHNAIDKIISAIIISRKLIITLILVSIVLLSIWSYFEKQAIYEDYILGNKAMEMNNIDKAIDYYKKNTSLKIISKVDNVDIPTSIYALARAYRIQGKSELAKQEFKKLIEYYPRWSFVDEIYWHLGTIAEEENKFSDATLLFEQCLKIAKFGDNKKNCEKGLSRTVKSLVIQK